MQRNPFQRLANAQRATARQAQIARPASVQAGGSSDSGNLVTAGSIDPDTLEWVGYGLLDVTTFGEGFRLA